MVCEERYQPPQYPILNQDLGSQKLAGSTIAANRQPHFHPQCMTAADKLLYNLEQLVTTALGTYTVNTLPQGLLFRMSTCVCMCTCICACVCACVCVYLPKMSLNLGSRSILQRSIQSQSSSVPSTLAILTSCRHEQEEHSYEYWQENDTRK